MKDNNIKNALLEIETIGYTQIRSVLSPSEVRKAKNLVNFNYKKINEKGNVIYPGAPTRNTSDKMVYNLQNKNIFFIEILMKKILTEIGKAKLNDIYYRFLPDSVLNYNLLYYNARSGGSRLDLHIDNMIPYQGKYTMIMQWLFILDKFDEKNGCTVLVPGSHQSGTYTLDHQIYQVLILLDVMVNQV